MKRLANFILKRFQYTDLRLLYLRVGTATPLFDLLTDWDKENLISWSQNEIPRFAGYHFGKSYSNALGLIVNLGVNDENVSDSRKDFWEYFLWKTELDPKPLALVYPNTAKAGSLTRSEIIESLSLIRLTDRPFEIFEHEDGVEEQIMQWLTRITAFDERRLESENEQNDV